jgi:hypothetical protein
MHKFGIPVEHMSAHGKAATQAATRGGARTVIYRERVPVAAIVPLTDLRALDPPDPSEISGEDPLLSLCGTFGDDAFVDQLSDLGQTVLFRK